MNRALFAAASGMAAQQRDLELIADNLANADVAGFKSATETFVDVPAPSGGTLGTAAAGTHLNFTQGKLERSGGPFDLAIDGPGFFKVVDGRGRAAYTRDGEFARFPDGTLRTPQGWRLAQLRIPENAIAATVAENGEVTVQTSAGKNSCGRIRLSEFPAPERLRAAGGTVFFETKESGRGREIAPNASSGPWIKFGMLEASNVTIVEAMMQILAAQRAYEANAKGVQAADEMMRIADNLSRD